MSVLRTGHMFRAASIIVALVGLLLVLQSTTMGMDAAGEVLRAHGGSMDLTSFQTVTGSYMASYRMLGGILLGIGVFRALQHP